jgi:hypothetical protein
MHVAGSNNGAYRFALAVGDAPSEGWADLVVQLVSESSVPARVERPRVLYLDFTPPQIVVGTDAVVRLPRSDALRDDIAALTDGASVAILFAANETLREPVAVTLGNTGLEAACTSQGGVWSTATDPSWTALTPSDRSARLGALFGGDSHEVAFAVTPLGANERLATGASVASDYVELRVDYRLRCLPNTQPAVHFSRCCSGVASGGICQAA